MRALGSLLPAALLTAAACSDKKPTELVEGDAGGGAGGAGGQGGLGGGAPGNLDVEYLDPSAPAGAKDAFAGPAASGVGRADVVYPLRGAMLGRNIGGMNVQWRAPQGAKIFRVRVLGPGGRARFFAGASACPMDRCQLPVPDDVWLQVAEANGGTEVTLTVDAVASAGASVSTSDGVPLTFSPGKIEGGLYYWSTQAEGIMRARLGDPTPTLFTNTGCRGCHAVTRDGCKVAFTQGLDTLELGIVSGAGAASIYQGPADDSMFVTWSPDGTRLLSTHHGQLVLRDGNGMELSRVPRNLVGTMGRNFANHPEWSPDGQTIVFTRGVPESDTLPYPGTKESHRGGEIAVIPYNDGMFGPATVLVPAVMGKEYHFYPHHSPDGKWVVFNSAPNPDSYDNPASRLRLVSSAGGPPKELDSATHQKDLSASWPKFSPFHQNGGNLLFIVFSSRIDYGWVLVQKEVPPIEPSWLGRPQLWVAAIDVSRPDDPSFAPFWLPSQLPTEGNHLAYWTTGLAGTVGGATCQ